MSDDVLWGLIGVPIVAFLCWLQLKDELAARQRLDPIQDGAGIAVCLVLLGGFFWATVFDHPEARIGWLAGLLLGGLVGWYDLRKTRIRVEGGRLLFYSSRLVAALLFVAGAWWNARHDGRNEITIKSASESPSAMFFCTALLTYAVVFLNGLYGVRRLGADGSQRSTLKKAPDRIEYGSRRRGRP